jgi:ectoine hydroxylase-related dioxygenase (phytanoyl-CoA dioxygenase family)
MLKNKQHQTLFQQNGFLKFPFLSPEKVQAIQQLYNSHAAAHAAVGNQMFFHASQDSLTRQQAKAIDEAAWEILRDDVNAHFEDYRLLIASFLVKEPGEKTYLQPHQDWNFTDEDKHYSFNIWIPLQPINRQTGSLLFLPGSHRIIPTLRPNHKFEWPFLDATPVIEKNFEEVTTQPGECVLINHGVIHASYPNVTSAPRVALVIGLIPKQANIYHFYSNDAKQVDMYYLQREDLYDIKSEVAPPPHKRVTGGHYLFPKANSTTVERWLTERHKAHTALPLLQQTSLQKSMDENGFCLLNGLPLQLLEQLRQLYLTRVKNPDSSGLHANHNRFSYEFNKSISDSIAQLLKPFLQQHFKNYEVFIAHFMVKASQTTSEMPLHQDWNIVDESQYNSYQVWIPLQMVSKHNGGLFVVPGSHRFFGNHRSGSLGLTRIPSTPVTDALKKDITTPPGTVVVYNNGLFHASYPNQSSEERISVIINIVQRNAPTTYFHYQEHKNEVAAYPFSSDDILHHLPDLEKGLLPAHFVPAALYPAPAIANKHINENHLKEAVAQHHLENPYRAYQPLLPIVQPLFLQQLLCHKGYIQLPFLTHSEVKEAQQLYKALHTPNTYHQGRYTTQEIEPAGQRQIVLDKLHTLLKPKLEQLFFDHKVPILQFFVKQPGTDGGIQFHADSTLLINPHLEAHYAIWIPLQDVGAQNGTLAMLPGSHLLNHHIAATSIPWPHSTLVEQQKNNTDTLQIRAGEIVVFDNRLLHASTFNSSNEPRIAIAGRVTHRLAQYYSFFKNENGVTVNTEPDNYYQHPHWNTGHAPSSSGLEIGTFTLV